MTIQSDTASLDATLQARRGRFPTVFNSHFGLPFRQAFFCLAPTPEIEVLYVQHHETPRDTPNDTPPRQTHAG